jgi:hypothetical protein
VVSGQLLQKPRMKSSGVCVVSCTAFRGSDRFTAIVLIRQRQGSIHLTAARGCDYHIFSWFWKYEGNTGS